MIKLSFWNRIFECFSTNFPLICSKAAGAKSSTISTINNICTSFKIPAFTPPFTFWRCFFSFVADLLKHFCDFQYLPLFFTSLLTGTSSTIKDNLLVNIRLTKYKFFGILQFSITWKHLSRAAILLLYLPSHKDSIFLFFLITSYSVSSSYSRRYLVISLSIAIAASLFICFS